MNEPHEHGSDRRAWKIALGLICAITLVRVVVLLVGGTELVGDEAHYWEWSRHLGLSYYSKGPGVAWLIATTTAVFGDTEFGVRIGAVACSALTMLALLWLGRRVGGDRGGGRVGVYAVLAWVAMPVFHGTAMLMTIDGPYVLWWAIALCAAWCVSEKLHAGKSAGGAIVAMGAAVGVGFLFKYTILFLPAALVVFALVRRKRLVWTGGSVFGLAAGGVVFAVVASPVVVWNAEYDWPTVKHLLGHLGMAGGDLAHKDAGDGWSYRPMWTLEYVGAQLGLIGPMLLLIGAGVVRGVRRGADPVDALLAWSGAPIVVVYLLVSFVTDVEGNWPIAGYTGLSLLVARRAPGAMDEWRERVARWRVAGRSTREGVFGKKPETAFQLGWHWAIGYGVVGGIGIMMIGAASRMPIVGDFVPMHRLSGSRALAARVEMVLEEAGGGVVIAERYDTASLLAFYMEGHPRVLCASAAIGDRKTAYDFFDDTDLETVIGGGVAHAVLVGGGERKWRRVLEAGTLRTVHEDTPIHIASGARLIRAGGGL